MKKKVIFINSHPIQYFAPLYSYMNSMGVKTACWYCSNAHIKSSFDQEFGVEIKWDIPLLKGYEYKFFKNYSWTPSETRGFFGLVNLGMILELFKIPASVIVVHGYHYCTHLLILLLGKINGHTICLRNDIPQSHEKFKKEWKQKMRRGFIKKLVLPRINYFLFVGIQNNLLYKNYGIEDNRLIFCPYSVDNRRFREDSEKLSSVKLALKTKIGIPFKHKVILYSGKYIEKKNPLDLLRAFIELNNSNSWLIMMGEGELRTQMEDLIKEHNTSRVILTGFINQLQISEYYSISDVFVMCSSIGENWGLSVNEAMNFNLPLILSDLTGCSDDFVIDGVNGLVFKTGNVKDLALKLKQILFEDWLTWETSSFDIISRYSFETIIKNITKLVK